MENDKPVVPEGTPDGETTDFLGGISKDDSSQTTPPQKDTTRQETPAEKRDKILGDYLEKLYAPDRFQTEGTRALAGELLKMMQDSMITIGDASIGNPPIQLPPDIALGGVLVSDGHVYPALFLPKDVDSRLKSGDKNLMQHSPEDALKWGLGVQTLVNQVNAPRGKHGETPFNKDQLIIPPELIKDGNLRLAAIRLYPEILSGTVPIPPPVLHNN